MALSIVSAASLSACQKPHQVSCGDATVQNQLLELTTNLSQSRFIIPRITQMKELSPATQEKNLSCKATVEYTHSLFPKQTLVQYYTYSINSQQQVTEFVTNEVQSKKLTSWENKLPQVISWQKTNSNTLAIIQLPASAQKNQQTQQLVLNQRTINLPPGKNYSSIVFNQAYSLNNQTIYTLAVYYNDVRDEQIAHNYFIAVESHDKFMLTEPFNYQPNTMQVKKDWIYFKDYPKYSFSEADDVAVYRYNYGKIILLQEAKPLSYYQQKFAHYSATKILKQIKNDGCLNGDQFYLSDICSAKVNTYCFEYNSMLKPKKDQAFWLLKEMCQIQQY